MFDVDTSPLLEEEDRRHKFSDLGELIEVRDFHGKLVESIRILSNGTFQTSKAGVITTAEIGPYIVRVTGHPAASRLQG